MKNFLRLGKRWVNPAHVALVELMNTPRGALPRVKLQVLGTPGNAPYELDGDDSRVVLDVLGWVPPAPPVVESPPVEATVPTPATPPPAPTAPMPPPSPEVVSSPQPVEGKAPLERKRK